MSVFKSELKQLITHEIGVRVDDALEAAKKDLAIFEGRQVAFADGSKAAEALLTFVDKDVEEGKFDLHVAEHVKRYLTRCSNALQNLSQQAAQHRMAQTGKVSGLDHTVKLLQNIIEDEKKKASQLQAIPSADPSPGDGSRPAAIPLVSIKTQRLAEEAAAEAEKAPAKRRGRKPRAANS